MDKFFGTAVTMFALMGEVDVAPAALGREARWIEGQLALAHLAQHYRFEPVHPGRPVETEALITLRPRHGLPMYVRPRTAPASQEKHPASVA